MNQFMLSMFRDEDMAELSKRGIRVEEALRQFDLLRDPTPRVRTLVRPATVGDGIRTIDHAAVPELLAIADTARLAGRVSKFVPASGAATRMFRLLSGALEALDRGEPEDTHAPDVDRFYENLDKLPFRRELTYCGVRPGLTGHARIVALDSMLRTPGLGYASKPKGLIAFHRYGDEARTPFEEHLVETARYAADEHGLCRVHFTIPEGSRADFEWLLENRRTELERATGVRFEVTFSVQSPSTDTISIAADHSLVRDSEGRLLFRPGGHGALLENLQRVEGDIVVVKNIDNVVPESRVLEIVFWKRILIGHLVTIQDSVRRFLLEIHNEDCDDEMLDHALDFASVQLSIGGAREMESESVDSKRAFLVRALDRPIRVCGMVRNSGEPGGGPFWTLDERGTSNLQIVESAEVDLDSEDQKAIWGASTHFNPVDLVLGVRDWQGNPYSLEFFADPGAVFRSRKSNGGKELIALERPGLWNGAMASWTTIFVEVPAATFAPVKTVFDLLRPEHQ